MSTDLGHISTELQNTMSNSIPLGPCSGDLAPSESSATALLNSPTPSPMIPSSLPYGVSIASDVASLSQLDQDHSAGTAATQQCNVTFLELPEPEDSSSPEANSTNSGPLRLNETEIHSPQVLSHPPTFLQPSRPDSTISLSPMRTHAFLYSSLIPSSQPIAVHDMRSRNHASDTLLPFTPASVSVEQPDATPLTAPQVFEPVNYITCSSPPSSSPPSLFSSSPVASSQSSALSDECPQQKTQYSVKNFSCIRSAPSESFHKYSHIDSGGSLSTPYCGSSAVSSYPLSPLLRKALSDHDMRPEPDLLEMNVGFECMDAAVPRLQEIEYSTPDQIAPSCSPPISSSVQLYSSPMTSPRPFEKPEAHLHDKLVPEPDEMKEYKTQEFCGEVHSSLREPLSHHDPSLGESLQSTALTAGEEGPPAAEPIKSSYLPSQHLVHTADWFSPGPGKVTTEGFTENKASLELLAFPNLPLGTVASSVTLSSDDDEGTVQVNSGNPSPLGLSSQKRKHVEIDDRKGFATTLGGANSDELEEESSKIKTNDGDPAHHIKPIPAGRALLPCPKRPTIASQKLTRKKLTTPFRSPMMRKPTSTSSVNLPVTVTSPILTPDGIIPAAKRPKSGNAQTPDLDNRLDPTISFATGSNKKHRTQRAALQFKSPLAISASSTAIQSVRLTPTIQALERKVQVLKRAIKVRQDKEEGTLERLVSKWTEAGREVAWEVWGLVKDRASNDEGGWENDKRKKERGFGDAWGWNCKQTPYVDDAERNWGWSVTPNVIEGEMGGLHGNGEVPRDECMEEQEDKKQDTVGTMLRQLGIAPETLGWNEDEEDFNGE